MTDSPRRLSKQEAELRLRGVRERRDRKVSEVQQEASEEMWREVREIQKAAGLGQNEIAAALKMHRDTVRRNYLRLQGEPETE